MQSQQNKGKLGQLRRYRYSYGPESLSLGGGGYGGSGYTQYVLTFSAYILTWAHLKSIQYQVVARCAEEGIGEISYLGWQSF
jgi:hypothetical protein